MASDASGALTTVVAALLACVMGYGACQILKCMRTSTEVSGGSARASATRSAGRRTGSNGVELSTGAGKTPSKWVPPSLKTARQARAFHQLDEPASKNLGDVLVE